MLALLALALAGLHFVFPLTYYWYARVRWLSRSWGVRVDPSYKPRVTVVIPTYNEAKLIEARLDNVAAQVYPKDRMEILVIDSASTDGTAELVKRWVERNGGNVRLIVETERRGKAAALNEMLKHASGEVFVIGDADAIWPENALSEALKWFSDPSIGAVSCLKKPIGSGAAGVEEGYRHYYNILRVAESKVYSTPIFHGELAAFRADLLRDMGGFPTDIGADDSHAATKIALMGFRAIIPDGLWVEERVPLAERYLHLVNPWILAAAVILLIASAIVYHSLLSWIILALGLSLLALKPYRTWIATQLCLIVGAVRNLYTKEIVKTN